jgi:hypothetical protein
MTRQTIMIMGKIKEDIVKRKISSADYNQGAKSSF